MEHIGLFEGVGGFALAANWIGWETIAWCEWNQYCKRVLRSRFPFADEYGDITKANFKSYANRDTILTGGFPCQPFSVAGKRKGKEDGRYLWPEFLRAAKESKSRWVVAENVYGLLNIDSGYTVEVICSDLEACGYETPVVFDCTSDAFGLSTLERHIWIITQAIDKRRKGGLPEQNENQQSTEREFSGSYPRTRKRWDISKTEFQRVDKRVSNKLDKADKERLKQMGNAIPPVVAYQIFRTIEAFEFQTV